MTADHGERVVRFCAGFFRQGAPESMPRLCALLLTLAADVCAVIGAAGKHDTSTIVIALSSAAAACLFSRKSGPVPPSSATSDASAAHAPQ